MLAHHWSKSSLVCGDLPTPDETRFGKCGVHFESVSINSDQTSSMELLCAPVDLQDCRITHGLLDRGAEGIQTSCCYSFRLCCQTSWWIPTPKLSGYREVPYSSLCTISLPTHRDVPCSGKCRPFQRLIVGENPPGLQGRQ